MNQMVRIGGFAAPISSHDGGSQATVRLLTGYADVVRDIGGEPATLLEEAGICAQLLQRPMARVPVRAMGTLLESTARRLGCPDFGMRLAERQAAETMMQPLDRLLRTAPTVRAAIESTVRHVGAFNSGLVLELDDDQPDALHLYDFRLVDGLTLFPQLMEQLLLLTHNSIVWLSAGFARPRAVWFSHLAVSAPVAYARRFNAVVRFGQEYDGLVLSDADLAARVTGCNAELFARESRMMAARFPVREDVAARVRQAIFRTLVHSDVCTRRQVARQLGMQERTLNRRLAKQGASFEAIRDDVRKNLAYRYLARADLPLTEIAGRLGYSELAVLSRCCRRWFGSPPRALRQQMLLAKAAMTSALADPRRLPA